MAESQTLLSVAGAIVNVSQSTSATTPLAIETVAGTPSASSFGVLGRMILTLIRVIPSTLLWTITFLSITLPSWLFTMFSTSLTITLNFTTLALMLLALVSTVSWVVRYRMNTSSRSLPQLERRDRPEVELFPEVQEESSKPGLSNYLDEFLSAIKVFGYLERPVFHELTRTMQTRKLIAGETIDLEDEKGFCLVVDGTVQIFVKSKHSNLDDDVSAETSLDNDDGPDRPKQSYQLLTTVKNGNPLSSLFSILSLFTESIKLRHYDGHSSGNASEGVQPRIPPGIVTPDTDSGSPLQLPHSQSRPPFRNRRSSSLASPTTGLRLQSVPLLSLEAEPEYQPRQPVHGSRSEPKSSKSVHPDIVARAVTDTTIAIIPATAFKRLTRLYPRATAHIVQVILTRLQRVTLATGQAYLGLSKEILRTEKLMNKYTTFELPDVLRDASITRLKEKFSKERERVPSEDSTKGIALHNPGISRRRRSSSSLRREAAAQARLTAARTSPPPDPGRSGVSAGDLLTNGGSRAGRLSFSQPLKTPAPALRDPRKSREYFSLSTPGNGSPVQLQHQEPMLDEDSIFREHILDCMCKTIGLSGTTNVLLNADSAQASPRLTGQKPAFHNNAFGYIDPYESSIDLDSESVTSASPSSLSISGRHSIQEELINEVEIVFFPKGSELVNQGERNPGLYYVIDGFLDVGVPCDDEQSEPSVVEVPARSDRMIHDLFSGPPLRKTRTSSSRTESTGRAGDSGKKKRDRKNLFVAKPGSLAGYLGTVSSHRSFVDVTAKTDCIVGFIPRLAVERIADKYPIVLLTLAKRLTTILPKVLLDLDFALEWVQVNAGQIIFKQREESDAIYIVLNGRLRAVREGKGGVMNVTGEFGQGDSVGELEVLTESPRPDSLHAIRDTELAKVPRSLFKSLALEHPTITIKMSKILAQRMRSLLSDPLRERGQEHTVVSAARSSVSATVNLRTVAILPITSGVPVVEFGHRLLHALSQIGTSVVSLNQAAILNHLGRHAFNRMGKLKLSQYLADLEEKYGLVLYVADTNVQSPWTQTCISQADCILLVGIAEGSPAIGEFERYLLTTKTTARKELVLLHAERGTVRSGLTSAWLRPRMWINGAHHHVQMSVRTTPEPVHPQFRRIGSAIKQRVQVLQAEIQKYTSRRVRQTPLYSAETPFKGDFHRLARRLCGKSVGLVLGGGGARGIAHVGVIRAMEEAGIPIDIIGGTSIGAFIGALYAWNADVVPMYGRAKKFAGRMGSIWRFLLDLTYPTSSYTTGHEFNRGLIKTFGDAQIEDFWLEYYCNTTNISKSRSEIHTNGYIWRYVRASMTLAGLLPPLTDNGDMLVDGGYIDNLTVAHMKSLGADVVFAVDVGSLDDHTPQEWGDSLSGFWVLFNRYNPFSSAPNPLTLPEIQARLAYVSSVDALEKAKATPGCFYMRPPIDPYGTLDFGKFEEIYKVGFEFAKQYLGQLREQGTLPITQESEEEKQNLRRTMAPRRASI